MITILPPHSNTVMDEWCQLLLGSNCFHAVYRITKEAARQDWRGTAKVRNKVPPQTVALLSYRLMECSLSQKQLEMGTGALKPWKA